MTKSVKSERRLHPRLERSLAVKIAANGYDFSTTTQNISCLGAYCHIDKYVPPFTRIAIKLDLPIASGGSRKDCKVECNGVIVRSEDDASGGFNVAIFFNHINDTQKRAISKYISQFLPYSDTPSLKAS